MTNPETSGWLHRLRERGVIRVAASYAVIAWLLLQIADVTFGPLGVPGWVMITLITAAVLGFPVAIVLLNEQRDLEPGFYLGVALIIGIVFSHPWVSRRWGRRSGRCPR